MRTIPNVHASETIEIHQIKRYTFFKMYSLHWFEAEFNENTILPLWAECGKWFPNGIYQPFR